MSADAMFVFLLAETSVHAGTGSVLSHVDLPIQREAHTNHPIVYASGVKGALRDHTHAWIDPPKNWREEREKHPKMARLEALFGPEEAEEHGGHGIFQEARVLLFPVRSFKGVFAWITCPYVLERFRRDLQAHAVPADDEVPSVRSMGEGRAIVPNDSTLWMNSQKKDSVMLEDYGFNPAEKGKGKAAEQLGSWLAEHALPPKPATPEGSAQPPPDPYEWWRDKLAKDVVILSDDDYSYMAEIHTEIQTHVKIDRKTGTAAKTGPWNEEALPPETLLYTSVASPKVLSDKIQEKLRGKEPLDILKEALKTVPVVHMAGDRSLGKGQLRATVFPQPQQPQTQGAGNAEPGTETR